jgi:Tfp pilus assembly protein FimV
MTEKNGTAPAKPDVETLRAEIKQTRADLGETVQALAAKADVKARAKEQVEQTKQRVKAQAAEATGKVREAAVQAGERVRAAAGSVSDSVADKAGTVSDKASQVDVEPVGGTDFTVNGRRLPVPLIAAGLAALVGIILVVRGSRR